MREAALAARAGGGDIRAMTANLLATLAPHRRKVLAAYWPMRDEADPRPAMAAHEGIVCLPIVTPRGQPLVFRQFDGRLDKGGFGTSHPPADMPEILPQVLIVPLAGFDRQGHRLGYGGGYYDRTLRKLRALGDVTAIGLGFAVQEVAAIPAESTDEPLDFIVTDREILRFAHPSAKGR